MSADAASVFIKLVRLLSVNVPFTSVLRSHICYAIQAARNVDRWWDYHILPECLLMHKMVGSCDVVVAVSFDTFYRIICVETKLFQYLLVNYIV